MDAPISCPTILATARRSRRRIAAANPSAMPEYGANSCFRNGHCIDIHQGNSIFTDQNKVLGRRNPVMTSVIPETALNFNGIPAGPASSTGNAGLGSPRRRSVRADAHGPPAHDPELNLA